MESKSRNNLLGILGLACVICIIFAVYQHKQLADMTRECEALGYENARQKDEIESLQNRNTELQTALDECEEKLSNVSVQYFNRDREAQDLEDKVLRGW